MNILLKYPTRGRPELFKKQLDRYFNMSSGKHNINCIVSCDLDDASMDYITYKDDRVIMIRGNSKSKIEAVNKDMEWSQLWDIVILVSDDMIVQKECYDDIIAKDIMKYYPNTDGCLFYNDGRVGNRLCTLSIMGRKYYDRFGYIYHPSYKSLWCDNEFHQVAKLLGKIQYIDNVIIKHEWMDATGNDTVHKVNDKYYETDKKNYMMRKSMGFPK